MEPPTAPPADPATYERRLLEVLEGGLLDREAEWRESTSPLIPDAVQLEGSYPDTRVTITMRDETQPGSRLGFRARIWEPSGLPRGGEAWPESFGGLLMIHLEETLVVALNESIDGGDGLQVQRDADVNWVVGLSSSTFFD